MKKRILLSLLLSVFISVGISGCIFNNSSSSTSINSSASINSLDSAKNNAKNTLQSYVDLSKYSDENKKKINEILENANKRIDEASSQDEIDNIISETKNAIDDIMTLAQEQLITAIENSKKEIDNYVSIEDYSNDNKELVLAAINTFKEEVEGCKTIDEVNQKLESTKSYIDSILTIVEEELVQIKKTSKEELDNYIKDRTIYSENGLKEIDRIISDAKENIDVANEASIIDAIISDAKVDLDAVKTIIDEEEENTLTFKNMLVEDTADLISLMNVEGTNLTIDTENRDSTLLHFGRQDGNTYSVLDTKIKIDYRSTEWSSLSIRFRAWDTAGGYHMEIRDSFIKVYASEWVDGQGKVETLLVENSYGIKDNEETHLQILCHEWQKTVLINGECIFSISEGARCVGYTYIETWQAGYTLSSPKYIEYADSASFMNDYGNLIWKESINK